LRGKVLWAVFAGGAIGSIARYLVLLGVAEIGLSEASLDLVVTAIVNLSGAFALGVIHKVAVGKTDTWSGFWATGVAGGFKTMSGLALITASAELGLSQIGYLYWLAVALQLVAGVVFYGLGRKLAKVR
jgi:fluoride ion exporter CrcB/FEX